VALCSTIGSAGRHCSAFYVGLTTCAAWCSSSAWQCTAAFVLLLFLIPTCHMDVSGTNKTLHQRQNKSGYMMRHNDGDDSEFNRLASLNVTANTVSEKAAANAVSERVRMCTWQATIDNLACQHWPSVRSIRLLSHCLEDCVRAATSLPRLCEVCFSVKFLHFACVRSPLAWCQCS